MSETKDIPRYFVMWRHNDENHWEAVSKEKFSPLCEKLLNEGINPASMFISAGDITHWIFPNYHKGKKQLWMAELYREINGTSVPSDYSGPRVKPREQPKQSDALYGYISPDGRYFHCEYVGHSALARKIVGKLYDVNDASRFLEDNGWLVIYHDPFHIGQYNVGMGLNKVMTDQQLATIEKSAFPPIPEG